MSPDLPIRWKLRDDLTVIDAEGAGGAAWILKDPLRLRYFRLQAEEMALLQLLDGQATWGQIIAVLQAGFPRTQFRDANLSEFLTATIQNCLLVATTPGHGERLAFMTKRETRRSWTKRLGSIVAWRWHGFDPTRLLDTLNVICGFVFHPAAAGLLCCWIAAVTAFMLSRLDTILLEAPRIGQFVTVTNLPYVIAAFVVLKVLHELGHGLACRRYGGECHELGALFIAFFPLLYCDVSDAWLFRSRWQRVLVSAAGVLIELFVASVCALLWMASVPGVAHTFFLNVVIVASVHTLLVNGNPLLRYDGYYILSDLLERPNLSSESRRAAARVCDRVAFGLQAPRVTGGSWWQESLFVVFGVASALYRVFITCIILWVVYETLEPHGFELFAQIAVLGTIASTGVMTVQAVRQRARHVRQHEVSRSRVWAGVAGVAGVVAAVLLIPFPRSVTAPFAVSPGASQAVYVAAAGHLMESVHYGEQVSAGDHIARLENLDLRRSFVAAEGEVALLEQNLLLMGAQRSQDPSIAQAIPAAETALAAAKSRLAALGESVARLDVTTDRGGIVYAPQVEIDQIVLESERESRPSREQASAPLAEGQERAWLETQTQLGWIGEPCDWLMTAYVDQADIDFVKDQAEAELSFQSAPGRLVTSKVVRIETTPEAEVPRELVLGNRVPVDPTDPAKPLATVYRVDLAIEGDDAQAMAIHAPLYSTGTVRIECNNEPLWSRLWRLLCQTFAINVR